MYFNLIIKKTIFKIDIDYFFSNIKTDILITLNT